MSIFNIIPIGLLASGSFIASGSFVAIKAIDKNNELNKKMNNVKIYSYPNEINHINQASLINDSNIIININKSNINDKFPIGIVKINKIKKIPLITYDRVYDIYTNKYERIKKVEHEIIKYPIGSQILFPNKYPKLQLDPNLLINKKISVLFDNSTFTKSSSISNIIELYESIIQKNISNFKSDINFNSTDELELEENLLKNNNDLYLIANPSSNLNVLNINSISDNRDSIVKKKFESEINHVNTISFFSYCLIGSGLFLGIINLLPQK